MANTISVWRMAYAVAISKASRKTVHAARAARGSMPIMKSAYAYLHAARDIHQIAEHAVSGLLHARGDRNRAERAHQVSVKQDQIRRATHGGEHVGFVQHLAAHAQL